MFLRYMTSTQQVKVSKTIRVVPSSEGVQVHFPCWEQIFLIIPTPDERRVRQRDSNTERHLDDAMLSLALSASLKSSKAAEWKNNDYPWIPNGCLPGQLLRGNEDKSGWEKNIKKESLIFGVVPRLKDKISGSFLKKICDNVSRFFRIGVNILMTRLRSFIS